MWLGSFFLKIFYVSGEYDLWMVVWTSGGIGDRGGGGKKMEWKKKGLDENELGRETENNRRSNKKKEWVQNIFHIDARGFPPGNDGTHHTQQRKATYLCMHEACIRCSLWPIHLLRSHSICTASFR